MNQYGKFLIILSVLITLGLSACGSGTTSTSTQSNPQPEQRQDPPISLPPGKPDTSDLSFKYFAVIREFKGNDKAALFGILPSKGTLQIKSVSGPSFLGKARVGTFDKDAINHLFLNTSVHLSPAEKEELESQYMGAQAIYFEKYDGDLCAGPDEEIKVSVVSLWGDLKINTAFTFSADPSLNGDCKFHELSEMSQY